MAFVCECNKSHIMTFDKTHKFISRHIIIKCLRFEKKNGPIYDQVLIPLRWGTVVWLAYPYGIECICSCLLLHLMQITHVIAFICPENLDLQDASHKRAKCGISFWVRIIVLYDTRRISYCTTLSQDEAEYHYTICSRKIHIWDM